LGTSTSKRAKPAPQTGHPVSVPDAVAHAIDATLLGGFEVRVDGQPIANAQWKLRHPRQLFQMLLLEPDGLPREQVLSVLWPDTDPTAAANRLHHTLHLVRGIFLTAGLSKAEPVALLQAETVRLNPVHAVAVDVRTFSQCVARARGLAGAADAQAEAALQQALALYRGELAQGCPVDEWLSGRRESLRVEFAWMLDRLAELKRKAGDDQAAIGLYQQLVDLDPGNELAHRSLMELYAATDHPERAIHQYSVCKRLLRHELDVEPSPATQAVLQRILSTPPAAPVRGATAPSSMPAPRWRYQPMPYAVPLLGRDADVQALCDQLLDPALRLLTVTGSAGLGKSRVAHAAVERVQEHFRNGAIAVSCTGLTDERQVANAVARALDLTLAADTSVRAQLAGRLRPCQLLLLLDRFEHVLAVAPQLAALLESAPELKVLVTSQVALRLDIEHVVTLPSLLQRGDAAAVEMFCRVAANAGAPVEGDAALAQAAAICRRLDGNPLAIELAAGQAPMLALPQILRSLEQPLAMLANPALDVEPQHRSLRDAIAWTCSVLDADTQTLLHALSLFGGHCGSGEPEQAFSALWSADTLRRCLQALLEAHVLRRRAAADERTPPGLEMPDAIAQFAAERLLESPQREALQSAHAAHATTQVRECFRRMRDESRHDIVAFVVDHRPSWQRAVSWLAQHGAAAEHLVMAYQYGVLALMAGATRNAMEVLQAAAARADLATSPERRMAAWCAYRLARACAWQADGELATRTLRAARRMARAEGDDYLHDRCLLQLAVERIDQRHFRAARHHLEALIAKHQAEQRQRDLVREHGLMASLRSAVGELTLAVDDARTALRCARELGSEHHIAYAAATLCEASLRIGDVARAQSLVALSYTLPEHALTPLRRQHFRLLECIADFECADFDSARTKTQRLLDTLQAYPLARTQAVARALAEMVAAEQGHDGAAPILDDEFAALPAGLHYDELTLRMLCYRLRRATLRGRTRRALSALQQALQALLRNPHPLWWSWTLEACAMAAAVQGDALTCKAAVNLSRQALRRAGCLPTPRQQLNWQRAQADASANAPWVEQRSLLPLAWPKTDRLLAEKLVAAMERALLEPHVAVSA
jgi:DNA-binding SARP family transcriptional activator/predicted ATPase